MATINRRAIVQEIISNGGYYHDDTRIVRIVQYNNVFDGGVAYGLVYEGEILDRYNTSANCLNPKTIFDAAQWDRARARQDPQADPVDDEGGEA